jgi:SAM-dependent methyltransferase
MCPVCESVERHRLYWLYYRRQTDLLNQDNEVRFLHFAPEMGIQRRLWRLAHLRYVSLDFVSPYVQIRADLCHLPLSDACADIVHCSHVLEHVSDDRAAMGHLLRILRPGGWGLIQVPIWTDGPTLEDPSITDPAERERIYGQDDHVRLYGPDVVERLRETGFDLDIIPASQFLSAEECKRYAIDPSEEIFHCRRPA